MLEFHLVDAFTSRPFCGNPATVAFLDAFPEAARMQQHARELGHSETAFVVARGDGEYDLRWFTPTAEMDLCGHATLAAAHVLDRDARFHTLSGVLACRRVGKGWIEMDLPADPVESHEYRSTLGLGGVVWGGRGTRDALFELGSAAAVRQLVPDLGALATIGSRGVIVTAVGDRSGVDFVSRVFAPNVGIAEDPVTGSAHCTLAAYWSPRFDKQTFVGEQASARGGMVRMHLDGDRVGIAGQAVTTGRVTLDF